MAQTKKNNDLFGTLIDELGECLFLILAQTLKGLKYLFIRFVLKIAPDPVFEKITKKQLHVKKQTDEIGALGIDTRYKRPFPLNCINFSKHSFIVGASGFGKTNLIRVLQENDLNCGRNVIFIDPKGDREALNEFVELTHNTDNFTYIFSESAKFTSPINPIKDGSVNQVTDRIMRAFEWSEQYYKDIAQRTLTKALRELEEKDIEFSLKSLHEILVQKYESKETVGLISKIENIVNSDFGHLLHGEEALSMTEIRNNNYNLYVGLSTQGYGETAKAIGKLIVGDLLYHSYHTLNLYNGEYRNPVSVYFDEFGSIVMPEFIELLNKCRAAKIQLTMAVQSISDIENLSLHVTKQIIENSSNIFILKQRLESSASFFAESIGTILTEKKTAVIEDGRKTGMESIREVHEMLVHPDIIKSLKIGQCILLTHEPAFLKLINIKRMPEVPMGLLFDGLEGLKYRRENGIPAY